MDTRKTDLTQGRIWKQLLLFSLPIVLSNLLQSMYNLFDMLIVGRLIGSAGLSALNVSGQVVSLITQAIIGIATGGNIIIGQYFGSKEAGHVKESVVTLFTLSLWLGAALAALCFFLARPILQLLGAPALEDSVTYMRVCSVGLFFVFVYNALSSALRAVGDSRRPLLFILITTLLNLGLDLLFVGPLGLGVFGAALATAISQGVSALLALVYVLRQKTLFGLSLTGLYSKKDKLRLILKVGLPVSFQMSVAALSWLSVTYIVNSYGVHVSAGNGISNKIKELCQTFIAAMANGASAMIAQNIGAEQFDRAKKIMYSAMAVTVSMALILIAAVELGADVFVRAFTDDAQDAAAAAQNLRIEILGQVFYASFLVYHALALGAGKTMFVFFSSFTNCIVVRIVLAFLLNHYFGILGLYWACMIAPSVSVPLGAWYTHSGRWRRTLTAAP